MANNHSTISDLFKNIANSIRSKNGSTESIVADNFPVEIANLKTGFDYNNHDITTILDYEFYNCADVRNVSCYNVTSIGISAFENCRTLKSVILWDNVTTIGENAFKGCSSNLTIYCMFDSQPDTWTENWNPDNCNVVWCGGAIDTWDVSSTSEDNVTVKLYNAKWNEGMYSLVVGGSGNMSDGGGPFNYYRSNICSGILYGITNIGYQLFSSYTFTNITIPDSVTNIGSYAFEGCSAFTNITLPDSVTSIGDGAFQYCTSLTNITIPDSVTSIGGYVFRDCTSLTNITIPDSVVNIDYNTFYNCTSLTNITIPNSVIIIGSNTFRGCTALTSIIYRGTIDQWNEIEFEYNWNQSTPIYTIYCSDGTITKDGKITYYFKGGEQ